jgi:transposase
MNPIELFWSKLKKLLRDAKARTYETLWEAAQRAKDEITSEDIDGYYERCGYV